MMPDKNWTNAENVMRAKIGNVKNELVELREKTIDKQAELRGLRDGLDTLIRFMPKEGE